tara:strand:+ start:82 stop:351 length:270 start_codon:yes stop_codon:yes gene_type:complete
LKLTTTEGVLLQASVSWDEDENYQREPVIWFRFENGQLCSSYYISTFHAIPDGQGLCLDGRRYEYKSISADLVRSCKRLIETTHPKTQN